MEDNSPDKFNDLCEQAFQKMADDDYASARLLLEDLCENNPGSVWAHESLANTYSRLDMYDKSEEIIDRCLTLEPDNDSALIIKSLILQIRKDWNASRKIAERIIQTNPDNADARLNLARAYSGLKEYQKAVSECNIILSRNPDDLEVVDEKIYALWCMGKVFDALKQFRIRWKTVPDDPKRLVYAAQLLQQVGCRTLDSTRRNEYWAEASNLTSRAYELVPDDPSVMVAYGSSQLCTGDCEVAVSMCLKFLNSNQATLQVVSTLVWSGIACGKADIVEKHLPILRTLDTSAVKARYHLATIMLFIRRIDLSVRRLFGRG
jgi:tetratricopeptide (TPR) repeat protein